MSQNPLPQPSTDENPTHIYPHRKIFFPNDLPQLYWSDWFVRTMEFLLKINIHLRAKTYQDIDLSTIPPQYKRLTLLLNNLTAEIDRYPPYHQNQRFGNTAFRDWFDPIQGIVTEALQEMVEMAGCDDSGYCAEIGIMLGDHRESLQNHLNWKNGVKAQTSGLMPFVSTPIPTGLSNNSHNVDDITINNNNNNNNDQPHQVFKKKQQTLTQQQQTPNTLHNSSISLGGSSTPNSLRGSNPDDNITPTPLPSTKPHTAQRANPLSQHTRPPSQSPSSTPRTSSGIGVDLGMAELSLSPSIASTTSIITTTSSTTSSSPSITSSVAPSVLSAALPSLSAASYQIPTSTSSTEPQEQHIALPCSLSQELTGYFLESFGNYVRIDYGTGHELAFITFLTALQRSGVLPVETPNEAIYVGIVIFDAYLKLVRRLQSIYWLEPAGSKGAWGLDDYQFVCFLWGSGQMIGLKEEKKIEDFPTITELFSSSKIQDKLARCDDNLQQQQQPDKSEQKPEQQNNTSRGLLFVDALQFVQLTKPGAGLQNSSPVLFSLSQVSSWEAINQGLLRMYGGEVIAKFPVMQHVKFGSLVPCNGVQKWTEYKNMKMAGLPTQNTMTPTVAVQHHPNDNDQKEDQNQKEHKNQQKNKEDIMAWYTNVSRLHNFLRIPPTILDIDNANHQHNVKMDAALIVRKK